MQQPWVAEMAREMEARPAREVVAEYAEITGRSISHLYRLARRAGWSSGRKGRGDAGSLRCGLTTEQIEAVAGLVETTRRDRKGCITPVARALEMAEDAGWLAPGQVSESTMQRLLRERHVSARHLEAQAPHTELRSEHPNHVHVFDVSVCVQYYLRGRGAKARTAIMREREFYKNKPHNESRVRRRLMRYALIDHTTGAFYLWYYEAAGETQLNLFDFLCRAWGGTGDERNPFRGVPRVLLMDAGSANTARAVTAMVERLGVDVPPGAPHNPRRQGAVEGLHEIIESWIESGLRIQPAESVEQLSAWALDKAVHYQWTRRHRRHGMPRMRAWLAITREQLRELPDRELVQALYTEPEQECSVTGSRHVSFRGQTYSLAHVPGLYRGAKVQAILNPWEWPVITVRTASGETYEARPLDRDGWGFSEDAATIGSEYRSPRESRTQQARKRIEEAAYGEDAPRTGGERQPYAGLRVFGYHADKLGDLAALPRPGTHMEVDTRGIAERRVPVVEALKRLRAEGVRVTPEINRRLREEYPHGVAASEMDALVERLAAGSDDASGQAGGADRAAM